MTSSVEQSPTVFRRRVHHQIRQLREAVIQLPDQLGDEDVTFLWELMASSEANERQVIGAMAALTVIDDPSAGAALKWFPDKMNPGERLHTFADIAYLVWRERHLE
jgi:hypothetical protein